MQMDSKVIDLPEKVFPKTNVIQFNAVKVDHNFYKGDELNLGWERKNFNIRGNSLVYWISPTNVSTQYMKDVDDVRENLSIRSDAMLHFIFTYYTMNDASWAVFVQRLFTKSVINYIQKQFSSATATVDGNDIYVLDRKFSVSYAYVNSGVAKFHFGINVESAGAPIPISSLSDLMNLFNETYGPAEIHNNPFAPLNFVRNVVTSFIEELDDIIDDSQKAYI